MLALVGLTAGPTALANDSSDTRIAVQHRKFQMAHEFRLGIGTMPVDPFQKGWTGSFSYTLHLNNYFAWEAFQVTGALLSSTDLRDELIDTFAIPEEDFAAPRYMVTTGFELAPIYGKQVFLNGLVVHQTLLIGFHGGFVFGDRETMGDTFSDFRPAVGVGIGYRLFWTKWSSLRIDVRDYLSFRRAIRNNESVRFENVMLVSFSLGFNVWRDDA